MNAPLTRTFSMPICIREKGRKEVASIPTPARLARTPRVAKLMALAIKYDGLIRDGTIRDYAEIARLGHITRARVSQIMNLLSLAPDIQEQLLFLPRVGHGRDPLIIRQLQPIAITPQWTKQREMWKALCTERGISLAIHESN